MYEVIAESDLVMLLISDGAQAKNYPRILAAMKPGSTLGLSHGFLLGVMKNDGAEFRKDINVVLVAPKGMGCAAPPCPARIPSPRHSNDTDNRADGTRESRLAWLALAGKPSRAGRCVRRHRGGGIRWRRRRYWR